MAFKEGDCVTIVGREVTPADLKSGLYYQHFTGLAGTVDRIYGSEVCVSVAPESLPADILKRHTDIQESIRRKWLNGLSGEARHRLTPEERQFNLAYTVLVHANDLSKTGKGDAKPVRIKSVKPVAPPDEPIIGEPAVVETVSKEAKATKRAKVAVKASEPQKKVKAEASPSGEEGLTPAELEFLRERERALKAKK